MNNEINSYIFNIFSQDISIFKNIIIMFLIILFFIIFIELYIIIQIN